MQNMTESAMSKTINKLCPSLISKIFSFRLKKQNNQSECK